MAETLMIGHLWHIQLICYMSGYVAQQTLGCLDKLFDIGCALNEYLVNHS